MLKQTLDAVARKESGKGVARKLRAAGRIPGVLYGPRNAPVPLSVNTHDFNRMLEKAKGERILFTLKVENEGSTEERLALIKELQLHPVNDRIIHIDFYEVFMDQELHVTVPVAYVGKAKGVEMEGGMLEIKRRSLNIACYPQNIPDRIEVDVTELGLGDAIHIGDVTPPEGVRIVDPARLTLVTVVATAAAVEAAAEEEEEEEEEATA